ncbi:MAG: hypothetical protein BGN86_07370 [Caulobacterales bacterium 68-7]|nr:TrbI/VirB10 family protein [Caulobacterales bacterium]OJU08067.1 MAG: hypothetical protein BGN86_07370 [Caulobacterales bacterium 68-7]
MSDLPPAAEPKASPASALQGPRAPVTRWNRRYLLAGGVALAAIVGFGFYIGFGGAGPARKPPADQQATDVTPTTPALAERYPGGYGDPSIQQVSGPGTAAMPPPGDLAASTSAPPPPAPVDPALQQARAQSEAARSASPFFQGASGGAPPSNLPAMPTVPATLPASTSVGVTPPAAADGEVLPGNGQVAKQAFAQTARADDYLANPLRPAISPWEVKAGTLIPAALITAINSDLPGEIVAQVTAPVFDHVTGRTVLIPQGSRLIGRYDSQVAYGQQRALIAWSRVIMPDGRSINIEAMEGADLTGASGLRDRVDSHFGQLARGVLLSTVFSVGAASAQDASARSSGSFVINSTANGVASQAQQVGGQIASRNLNRQPTIRIRAGWPLRVLVNKDMVLAPYP